MENLDLKKLESAQVLSKEGQAGIVDSLVAKVVNGELDTLQIYVQMKALNEIIEKFLKHPEIVKSTESELRFFGDNAPEFYGAKTTIVSSVKIDYKSSEDAIYNKLLSEKEAISTKIKAREMFLKSLEDDIEYTDSGEICKVKVPKKAESKYLKVTFRK